MNIKAKISISRVRGNFHIDKPVEIRLMDDSSGVTFAEISVSLENFSEALFGLSHVECDAEVYPDAPLGKVVETKTELIPRPAYTSVKYPEERKALAAKLFKPYEVDGWRGYVDDLFNMHRANGDNMMVTFSRFVDPRRPS